MEVDTPDDSGGSVSGPQTSEDALALLAQIVDTPFVVHPAAGDGEKVIIVDTTLDGELVPDAGDEAADAVAAANFERLDPSFGRCAADCPLCPLDVENNSAFMNVITDMRERGQPIDSIAVAVREVWAGMYGSAPPPARFVPHVAGIVRRDDGYNFEKVVQAHTSLIFYHMARMRTLKPDEAADGGPPPDADADARPLDPCDVKTLDMLTTSLGKMVRTAEMAQRVRTAREAGRRQKM
jgi:hypothetical protein